jgi:ubiquinone/menaquinone biosynthesis C-methylase UbiE
MLKDIQQNVAVHNRIARKYEAIHDEIFNDIEQSRLHSLLKLAISQIESGRSPVQALDVGCGSGNLTSHLLELGADVTAADVAQGFLDLVSDRYSGRAFSTFRLNGSDLGGIADSSFDLVATYSVLHHIPDYLAASAEIARVTRPGGVVVIDHEATPHHWQPDPVYSRFQREALRFDWRKYLRPSNYVHRVRRVFDPRHSNEGDIHVWADDHVEWHKVADVMRQSGLEVIAEQDYLLYRGLYRPEVYERYRDRCTDTRAMIFRKRSEDAVSRRPRHWHRRKRDRHCRKAAVTPD